jgi:DNA-binding XRE family transcriptional regulator
MTKQFVENVWLSTETCCNCGMVFAMTSDFMRRRRDDRSAFYCPAGHQQYYQADQLSKLRDEVERKDRELVEKNVQLCDVKSRLSSVSRAHTKMRTRIVNGVCPCCNRTFQNLMQHMRTEHADFSSNKALLALRTAFGLTQSGLAKEIGIQAPYVSSYENEKYVPQYAKKRIAQWIETHDKAPT